MWSHIIIAILGFAAGCTFKELLSSKGGSNPQANQESPQSNTIPPLIPSVPTHQPMMVKDFSLSSIKYVFDDNNVQLINSGSFGVLLRTIRDNSYKKLLKLFIDEAKSPKDLVSLLKNGITPTFEVRPTSSSAAPYIEEEKLDNYISQEGVSTSNFKSCRDKAVFLLSLNHNKGIDDFKKTLGIYMTEILELDKNGMDITDLYNQIMKIISDRYSYIA